MPPLTLPTQSTPPTVSADRALSTGPIARNPAGARSAEVVAADQCAVLRRLAREIEQLESSGRSATTELRVSSAGCAGLDALLPQGGYAAGTVVEYLRTAPACGASTLAWAAAAAAARASVSGFLVVVDTQHNIYPPALTSHGIDLGKVIFVRPQSQADALWAVDQALRTVAVAAVVAELERIDDRSARRLQLAAESGAGLALLLRSAAARQQPSWAEVQWLVGAAPTPRSGSPVTYAPRRVTGNSATGGSARCAGVPDSRRWLVQLARVRGGRAGQSVCLEMNPLTGQLKLAAPTDVQRNSHGDSASPIAAPSQSAVHLAAQLAHATPPSAADHRAGLAPRRVAAG